MEGGNDLDDTTKERSTSFRFSSRTSSFSASSKSSLSSFASSRCCSYSAEARREWAGVTASLRHRSLQFIPYLRPEIEEEAVHRKCMQAELLARHRKVLRATEERERRDVSSPIPSFQRQRKGICLLKALPMDRFLLFFFFSFSLASPPFDLLDIAPLCLSFCLPP